MKLTMFYVFFKEKSRFKITKNALHIFKTPSHFTENVFTLRSKETLYNCVNQSEHSFRYFLRLFTNQSYPLHLCWKTFKTSWNSVIVKLGYLPSSVKTTLNKMVRTNSTATAWQPIFSADFVDPNFLSACISRKPYH